MGKKKNEKKTNRKKEFREIISTRLEAAFSEFKDATGEKRFNAAIKKGAKLLSQLLFVKEKKEKSSEVKELSV